MCNCANCRAQSAEMKYETAYAHENSFEVASQPNSRGQSILDEILSQESTFENSTNLESEILGALNWNKVKKHFSQRHRTTERSQKNTEILHACIGIKVKSFTLCNSVNSVVKAFSVFLW